MHSKLAKYPHYTRHLGSRRLKIPNADNGDDAKMGEMVTALPNVYRDSSEFVTLVYPGEYSHVLKLWFEVFPEKVVFGSDAFSYTREVNVPGNVPACHSHGTYCTAALAEMVSQGEITDREPCKLLVNISTTRRQNCSACSRCR
jgi:hypothetical protein